MRPVPPLVSLARRHAADTGFTRSCTDGHGRLMAALAAGAESVGEAGTGCGVGTAWLRSGLRDGGRITTVELDAERAAFAASLFADDQAVTVLSDDWRALFRHAPFDLLFLDGGGGSAEIDVVVDLVRPGGTVVLDDFSPNADWPRRFQGAVDEPRMTWLTDPRFAAVEVGTDPDPAPHTVAIVATRR